MFNVEKQLRIKAGLLQYCREHIEARLVLLRISISNAQMSANEETKSSAGDKYETGRAMAQLEIEKLQQQLYDAQRMESILNGTSLQLMDRVQPGAVVITNHENYYVNLSLGKAVVDGVSLITLSLASPLGQLLKNKTKGNEFNFNNRDYRVESVF